jgi:hypothetical protein
LRWNKKTFHDFARIALIQLFDQTAHSAEFIAGELHCRVGRIGQQPK